MVKPDLTAESLRHYLDYNADTGIFTWRFTRKGATAGVVAGATHKRNGYVSISVFYKDYYAHRLAWLHVHGSWPMALIDHINGIKSDNRIANLRDVHRSVNGQNQKSANKDNSTGLLGASFDRLTGKFRAQIHLDGRNSYIGSYETALQAHEAYILAKRKIHPGCTI